MKIQIVLLSVAFAITPLLANEGHQHGAGEPAASKEVSSQKYTCPMHPEVISDKPGKCPKCGMNLVLVKPSPTPNK